MTGKWRGILNGAGLEPGMYSWWNAIPCGLGRPLSAQDKGRGRGYLNRAIDLHKELYVVIAVGAVAQDVVKASRTSIKVLTTRSPLRSSNGQRERIRTTFAQARMDAYPWASTGTDDCGYHGEPRPVAAPALRAGRVGRAATCGAPGSGSGRGTVDAVGFCEAG